MFILPMVCLFSTVCWRCNFNFRFLKILKWRKTPKISTTPNLKHNENLDKTDLISKRLQETVVHKPSERDDEAVPRETA